MHIVEQYMTYPVNGKVQDRYAESLLQILMEDGPQALKDPTNYDVRANIMWAATQALNGTLSLGVPGDWSIHAIGHQITALYGLITHKHWRCVTSNLELQERAEESQTAAICQPRVRHYCRR